MKELCAALGIEKLRTTAYKPSTNGALERFHRTLNSMLAKVVDDNHRDWDDRLQAVMAAYRASPHDSTGFTPNFRFVGAGVPGAVGSAGGTAAEGEEERVGQSRCVRVSGSNRFDGRRTTPYGPIWVGRRAEQGQVRHEGEAGPISGRGMGIPVLSASSTGEKRQMDAVITAGRSWSPRCWAP